MAASTLVSPTPAPAGPGRARRGRYVVPFLGFCASFAFVSASLVNPLSGAEATTRVVGGASVLVAPGQSYSVAGASAVTVDRDGYGVTLPPPPEPEPEPVVADVTAETASVDESSSSAAAPAVSAAPAAGVPDPGSAKAIAAGMVSARGWGTGEYDCLVSLWNKESGWNVYASNGSSGAYGIPQSLPGSKMATAGADWQTNPATQITWGLNYISGVYGSPCGAWSHSQAVNWY
ncbi:lytic transglycosylase domain-containing protein [Frigoribacterium faeni]|uniref:Transglycosylase SLT domain-containing protein n=1 Tax=Frigoribacterium faeni TaxID=145483 RepID=A0A7W3JGL9_9MICO|nr:lytic transglycosylase domain-containing protein [Frigoribacterium faeni]MBA8812448.1 hypothetical protein [Frigoribacterium faeni]BFF13525.1 hypothetical protein GCM10025699_48280 [Microbacterium flavescens]GEK81835.1 hypothetical protein FFA01_01440 [Frigoribacterium faeni]